MADFEDNQFNEFGRPHGIGGPPDERSFEEKLEIAQARMREAILRESPPSRPQRKSRLWFDDPRYED